MTRDLVSPRQLVTLLQQTDSGTGALSNDLSRFRTGELGSSGTSGSIGLLASIIAAAFIFDSWLITGTLDPFMRFHSMLAFRRFFPWKSFSGRMTRTMGRSFWSDPAHGPDTDLGSPNQNIHKSMGWALFWATVDGSEIPNNHHLGFGAKTCRKSWDFNSTTNLNWWVCPISSCHQRCISCGENPRYTQSWRDSWPIFVDLIAWQLGISQMWPKSLRKGRLVPVDQHMRYRLTSSIWIKRMYSKRKRECPTPSIVDLFFDILILCLAWNQHCHTEFTNK